MKRDEEDTGKYDASKHPLIKKLGRIIAFHSAYADLPGCNVNAALLLSQMVHWSDKGDLADYWVYKTREEWREETRLTLREIDAARIALVNAKILYERRAGMPAQLYW